MSEDKDVKKEEETTEEAPAKEAKEEAPAEEAKKEAPAEEPATEEEEVEVPEQFKKIVEEIEKMSVLELNELVKVFEKKFGVSATAAAAAPAAGAGGDAEEKSSFDIELAEFGGNKIAVIKVVKEISGLGLKEAKDLVESAPTVVKEGVKKEEAEEIKGKLEEAGAKVNLQ